MSLYKNSDIKSIEYLKNTFRIKWRMTGWCNYHCDYCCNGWNQSTFTPQYKLEDEAIKINEFIKFNNIKEPIQLILLGGEVSFYNLSKIVSKINNIKYINLTTNFSNTLDSYKEFLLWCKESDIKCTLICSKHNENKEFKNKFIELYNWCKENKCLKPKVALVVTERFNIDLLEEFKDIDQTCLLIHQADDYENDNKIYQLNKHQLSIKEYISNIEKNKTVSNYKVIFKDNSEINFNSICHFIDNLDNNGFIPSNCKCSAGVNNILINWNGDILLNQCLPLRNKVVGNIIENCKIKLDRNYINCNNEKIRCSICNGVSIYKER